MSTPDTLTRELAALDDALAGRAVDPDLADLAELAVALRDERPAPEPAFTRDARRAGGSAASRAPRAKRRRGVKSPRLTLPALGTAASVLLVVVIATSIPNGGGGEAARRRRGRQRGDRRGGRAGGDAASPARGRGPRPGRRSAAAPPRPTRPRRTTTVGPLRPDAPAPRADGRPAARRALGRARARHARRGRSIARRGDHPRHRRARRLRRLLDGLVELERRSSSCGCPSASCRPR